MSDAVVGATQPGLEVPENPMDAREDLGSSPRAPTGLNVIADQ
jgi:hypothetical protein